MFGGLTVLLHHGLFFCGLCSVWKVWFCGCVHKGGSGWNCRRTMLPNQVTCPPEAMHDCVMVDRINRCCGMQCWVVKLSGFGGGKIGSWRVVFQRLACAGMCCHVLLIRRRRQPLSPTSGGGDPSPSRGFAVCQGRPCALIYVW